MRSRRIRTRTRLSGECCRGYGHGYAVMGATAVVCLWLELTARMETMGRLIGKIPPNPEWVRVYAETQKFGASGRSMSAASMSSTKSKVGPPRRVSRSVSKSNGVSFERRGLERV